MRLSLYALIVLVWFSTLASADIKIKTRTTVMGHSTESTVYIKGARMRNETSYGGGRFNAVTIMQCDQKRAVTITGNQCMVLPMGGGESSCPNTQAMGAAMGGRMPAASSKGGVVTITRNSTDTGERQDMFGYKARHIKTTMSMDPSPDACNQSHMKMETDGWYADLSAGLSCGDNSYQAMACNGSRGCSDRIVMKDSGAALGYPLKQTMTMSMPQGTFTTTTEVIELTNTSLEASLFDAPANCRAVDMSAMMGGAAGRTSNAAPETSPAPTAAPQPAAAPAPAVAPKAAGVTRVGVVKIKDMSGESLPTDNLILDLISEIAKQQLEAIPLDAEAPQDAVLEEAKSKQCDYVVYTVSTQVKEPNTGGLTPMPKGATLDPAKFQALTNITLYKVGKLQPEFKDVPLAGDAPQFAVDAVSATFAQESNKIAQQVADDAHPKPASKTTKPAAKPATTSNKPK
ncbi:MAG: hypothetical protein WA655_24690 [Candidatus Korobacteraceae bacterium]